MLREKENLSKESKLDLSAVLARDDVYEMQEYHNKKLYDFNLGETVDEKVLVKKLSEKPPPTEN